MATEVKMDKKTLEVKIVGLSPLVMIQYRREIYPIEVVLTPLEKLLQLFKRKRFLL